MMVNSVFIEIISELSIFILFHMYCTVIWESLVVGWLQSTSYRKYKIKRQGSLFYAIRNQRYNTIGARPEFQSGVDSRASILHQVLV